MKLLKSLWDRFAQSSISKIVEWLILALLSIGTAMLEFVWNRSPSQAILIGLGAALLVAWTLVALKSLRIKTSTGSSEALAANQTQQTPYRPVGRLVATKEQLAQPRICDVVVFINYIPNEPGCDFLFRNRVFERCSIFGPAVVFFFPSTYETGSNWYSRGPEGSGAHIWPVPANKILVGAMLFDDCRFENCSFYDIGLVVAYPAEQPSSPDQISTAHQARPEIEPPAASSSG